MSSVSGSLEADVWKTANRLCKAKWIVASDFFWKMHKAFSERHCDSELKHCRQNGLNSFPPGLLLLCYDAMMSLTARKALASLFQGILR